MMTPENLRGLTVRDAMQPLGSPVSRAGERVGEVARRQIAQSRSRRSQCSWTSGRLAGLITRGCAVRGAEEGRKAADRGRAPARNDAPGLRPDCALIDAQERLQARTARPLWSITAIAVGAAESARISRGSRQRSRLCGVSPP